MTQVSVYTVLGWEGSWGVKSLQRVLWGEWAQLDAKRDPFLLKSDKG